MSLDLILSPDRRYLTILAAGETAMPELDAALKQAVHLCRDNGVRRVLVDARRMRASFSRLDLFRLASGLPAIGFLPGTHFAVLIDLDTPEIHYFEQVAGSRGAHVDHYLNVDEALDVLLAPAFG